MEHPPFKPVFEQFEEHNPHIDQASEPEVVRFNPEMTTLLTDSRTGEQVYVVTAEVLAEHTRENLATAMVARKTFYDTYRFIHGGGLGRWIIQDPTYSYDTRQSTMGIDIHGLPLIVEQLQLGMGPKRSFGSIKKQILKEYCDAVFCGQIPPTS